MDQFVQELVKKKEEAKQAVVDLEIAINAIQKTCPHPKWIYVGHDSHYSYQECERCGYEEKC